LGVLGGAKNRGENYDMKTSAIIQLYIAMCSGFCDRFVSS
jgi:hypothetical protein